MYRRILDHERYRIYRHVYHPPIEWRLKWRAASLTSTPCRHSITVGASVSPSLPCDLPVKIATTITFFASLNTIIMKRLTLSFVYCDSRIITSSFFVPVMRRGRKKKNWGRNCLYRSRDHRRKWNMVFGRVHACFSPNHFCFKKKLMVKRQNIFEEFFEDTHRNRKLN